MSVFSKWSDEARRCSEQITLHILINGEGAYGRWAAIRLSDGGSDGVLYDTKADAVAHQLHETQCCYVRIPPSGMNAKQAENFIAFNRMLYANGARISDPDRQYHLPHDMTGGRLDRSHR